MKSRQCEASIVGADGSLLQRGFVRCTGLTGHPDAEGRWFCPNHRGGHIRVPRTRTRQPIDEDAVRLLFRQGLTVKQMVERLQAPGPDGIPRGPAHSTVHAILQRLGLNIRERNRSR